MRKDNQTLGWRDSVSQMSYRCSHSQINSSLSLLSATNTAIPCVISCTIANSFKDQMYFTLRGKKPMFSLQCESPNPELCIYWTIPLLPTKPSLEWFAPQFGKLACLWHRGVATKVEWFSRVDGWPPDIWNDRECTLGWLCVYSLLEPSCADACIWCVLGRAADSS